MYNYRVITAKTMMLGSRSHDGDSATMIVTTWTITTASASAKRLLPSLRSSSVVKRLR